MADHQGQEVPVSTDEDRSAGLCVLGSISIHVDGRVVAMGGEKPRRLLAMLILHQNSVVSAERLMQALWEDDPPERALPTLQSYVSRLRRLLPPGARLVTQAPGYRLEVDPGITDVGRFESELADALEKLDGEPGAAVHRLDQALANWQGDAFAEFSGEWWARAEATRLDELRLHARETRVAALLG